MLDHILKTLVDYLNPFRVKQKTQGIYILTKIQKNKRTCETSPNLTFTLRK